MADPPDAAVAVRPPGYRYAKAECGCCRYAQWVGEPSTLYPNGKLVSSCRLLGVEIDLAYVCDDFAFGIDSRLLGWEERRHTADMRKGE